MSDYPVDSPRFNVFLGFTWLMALGIVATFLLNLAGIVDEVIVLAAVIVLGGPAFLLMLFADKD
jgi:hypothetical protein